MYILINRHLSDLLLVQPICALVNDPVFPFTFQIEANIFEPQGISYLDAEGTFITNELLPVVQKSFSGKKVYLNIQIQGLAAHEAAKRHAPAAGANWEAFLSISHSLHNGSS